jgi:hypothetical protein
VHHWLIDCLYAQLAFLNLYKHSSSPAHVSFVHCRPSVEYKGVIPPDQLQDKKTQLEKQANELISKGAKV